MTAELRLLDLARANTWTDEEIKAIARQDRRSAYDLAVSRLRAPSSSQSFRDLLTVHPTCIASSAAIIAIAPRGDGGRPPRFANDVARNATTIGADRHRATRAVPRDDSPTGRTAETRTDWNALRCLVPTSSRLGV